MIWTILLWAWLIAPFVLATIAVVRWRKHNWGNRWYTRWGAFFGRFFSSLAIGAVVMVIASIVLSFVATVTGEDRTRSWDVKLRALNTGSEIHGQFYLGSGQIDEKPVFRFLYEQADGGVKLSSVPASKTTVYEEDTAPRLTTYETQRHANGFWAPFGITAFKSYAYEFRVPEGSVLKTYEVTP